MDALLILKGEKEICYYYIDFFKEILDILDNKTYDHFLEYLSNLKKKEGEVHYYIKYLIHDLMKQKHNKN